jgi:hypothetical protein
MGALRARVDAHAAGGIARDDTHIPSGIPLRTVLKIFEACL